MDTYKEILQHLDVRFSAGDFDPLQRNTNPTQKPPTALLPMLCNDILYQHSASNGSPLSGDYQVAIHHIADTGYHSTNNGYPTDTCAVQEACSELWLYVLHAIAASPPNVNWYDVWYRTTESDFPGHDAQRVLQALPNIQVYGYCFDVATLTDPPTIARHMAAFKGHVLAALGVQL